MDSADYADISDASARFGGGAPHNTRLFAMKAAPRNLGGGVMMEAASNIMAPSMAVLADEEPDYDLGGPPSSSYSYDTSGNDGEQATLARAGRASSPESFASKLKENVSYVGWIIGGLLVGYILYVLMRGGKNNGDNLKKE